MSHNFYCIGLTGGIATGKSTFVSIIKELLPQVAVFDADQCVQNLYHDKSIQHAITQHFGTGSKSSEGINKQYLREKVFSQKGAKQFLEQLFHPRVKEECLAFMEKSIKKNASSLFVADIPLLFETSFDFGQSHNLLVATSRETQIARLKARNAWDDKTIQGVLYSQIPIDAKLDLADVVFWNEGSVENLKKQCQRFLLSLDFNLPI